MGADLFSIGRSSLGAAKKSLATTSHNIANANTEGFSRQRVTTETNIPVGEGSTIFGTGTNIREVKRVHDKLVEAKLSRSITNHSYHENRTQRLGQLEDIFNEVNSEGLNKIMNRFFNSFRELSNQPENETVRAIVRDNANLVIADIKRTDAALRETKATIDKKLEAAVIDINSLSETVCKLNKEIIVLEASGGETGDLRDQRDTAVRSLAEYFDLHTYEDEKGRYVVNIQGAGSLVAGGSFNKMEVGRIQDKDSRPHDEGQVEIYFQGKPTSPITDNIKGGSLGAEVKTRNEDLQQLRDRLNNVTYNLVMATNAIHRRGYINKPIPTDQNGNIVDNGSLGKITDINFFKVPMDLDRAAEYIALSDEVSSDLDNIATGLAPNSPGDNRVAIAISKLQHEKILGSGNTTFEEEYLKAVGQIGLRTAKSKIDTEQASGILAQAKSFKERISGVSIDEETASMVRYQHAYDASAKVIKTADEMFQSVLGMMR